MRFETTPETDPTAGVTPRVPWRVATCEVLRGYRLHVRFQDGTEGEVDLSELVHAPDAGVFADLRDEAVFRQARVELGVVMWPNGVDLAPDAMYDAIRRDGVWRVEL